MCGGAVTAGSTVRDSLRRVKSLRRRAFRCVPLSLKQHLWCVAGALGVVPANILGKQLADDQVSWLSIQEDHDLVKDFDVRVHRPQWTS